MKTISTIILLIFSILYFISSTLSAKDDFPVLKGPYLGQKPPGLTPELFAKGIISTELHDDAAPIFSPDGKEVYFRIVYKVEGRYYGTIFFMKQESGKWSYPEAAPFSGKFMDGGVKFSHDGHKLYLGSIRGGSDASTTSGMDLWEIERIGGVWAEPKRLDGLNSENNEMNPCVSPDGMLYWIVEKKRNDPEPIIYRSKIVDNRWVEKERFEFFPDRSMPVRIYAFSLDGRYILLTMRNSKNDINMFVSFKTDEGTWGDPISLGPNINSEFMDKCPMLSPDGKYLFFVSSRPNQNKNPQKKWDSPLFHGHEKIVGADIYWVSVKIIEQLKPKDLKPKEGRRLK